MQPAQNVKVQIAIARQTMNTNVVTGNAIDVRGFDAARFVIVAQSANSTAIPSNITLEHADDTESTSFASFATISSGLPTSIDSTALTNKDCWAYISTDLRGKKRYLRMKMANSIATTAVVSVVAILEDPAFAPVTPAQRGVKTIYDASASAPVSV